MVKLEALKHFGDMHEIARTADNDKESFERIMETRDDVYEYLPSRGHVIAYMREQLSVRYPELVTELGV